MSVSRSLPGRTLRRRLAAWLLALAAPAAAVDVGIVAESTSPLTRPRVFIASRDPATHGGDVQAVRAGADGTDDADGPALWSAARQLLARGPELAAERALLTATPHPRWLRWEFLSLAEQTAAGVTPARVAAWRGAPLGEIRNANLWLVPARAASAQAPERPAMVYAGAADGMLHGLDADDGQERIAYLPHALLARSAEAPGPTATANTVAGVDGPLFAADIAGDAGAPARTLLVGALGAGGRGYFILDVSDPVRFAAEPPQQLVHTDQTLPSDPDIGQIFGPPVVDDADPKRSRQIVRLNDGRWAAVMGNGYFSPSQRPVLLIQYLDERNRHPLTGARELRKLSPCVGSQACASRGGNGLAPPRLLDIDGNGTADVAYAGDLQGQVWKFDLSGPVPDGAAEDAWRVAFGGAPLFTARAPDRQAQPITTAPYVVAHPRGGLMLVVGTGRHLLAGDTASRTTQTLYGLYDNSAMLATGTRVRIQDAAPIAAGASSEARPASLVAQRTTAAVTLAGVRYHHASREPVAYGGPDAPRGWYLDLPLPGQRVLQHPRAFEGYKALVHSVVPDGGGTWLSGEAYVSVLNVLTGQPPQQPAFVVEAFGGDASTLAMAGTPAGPAWAMRMRNGLQLRFGAQGRLALRGASTTGQRAGWRERP